MRNSLTLADYEWLAEVRYQIRRYLRFSEQASRAAERVQESLPGLSAREVHEGARELREYRRRVEECPAPRPPRRPALIHRAGHGYGVHRESGAAAAIFRLPR